MRICSFNANGIRAAARKGFYEWFAQQDIDVLCIQETKAQIDQLSDPQFHPEGYHCYYEDARSRKGYSGVAIYARAEPSEVLRGFPEIEEFDAEGRSIEARFGNLSVISLYLPSGSSGDHRQASKDRFLEYYMPKLKEKAASGRDYIICGDWNIAHKSIDLKNNKPNEKNSGHLPHERAWMDVLFGEPEHQHTGEPVAENAGFVDAFRVVDPRDGRYTWWSNRGQAWANDVGWRIDYQVITEGLKDKVQDAAIYREEKFSDHAPLILDYDMSL